MGKHLETRNPEWGKVEADGETKTTVKYESLYDGRGSLHGSGVKTVRLVEGMVYRWTHRTTSNTATKRYKVLDIDPESEEITYKNLRSGSVITQHVSKFYPWKRKNTDNLDVEHGVIESRKFNEKELDEYLPGLSDTEVESYTSG